MDPKLYKEAVGGKEEPKLFSQISCSSQLFSWINWSSKPDKKLSKEKMGGKENEDNDNDVPHLMRYINGQQLEQQLTSRKNTILHVAAQFGDKKYVEKILEKSSPRLLRCLLCCLNIDDETPFHIAVRGEHLDIVKALIECAKRLDQEVESGGGATEEMLRAQNKDNDTALHIAVQSWLNLESTKLLLEWKSDLIKETDEYGWIPLHYAARCGNKDGVKRILENDKSVAYITTDEEGDEMSALHIAAAHGHVNVMEELLLCCPDCWEMVNGKGQNVVHIAVEMEQREVTYIF
ncbi:Ankyrin-1 [Camellia lanceoleosa]|uniref:Ankyrin-1 n=1 Tax=Camellia lanceoleosa TaxID=1840588 RepID=A0ACC0GSR6_9ERIC|nr:Ankyrin-1 [Camellia lanceoleosa]